MSVEEIFNHLNKDISIINKFIKENVDQYYDLIFSVEFEKEKNKIYCNNVNKQKDVKIDDRVVILYGNINVTIINTVELIKFIRINNIKKILK